MTKPLVFDTILSEDEARQRYEAAAYAMQSGVAMRMNYDVDSTAPKHLRVGVNSAMVDSSALAELLIHKGVITPAEYLTALCYGMEREAKLYEELLSAQYGVDIHLG